jgi:hypothetical protein
MTVLTNAKSNNSKLEVPLCFTTLSVMQLWDLWFFGNKSKNEPPLRNYISEFKEVKYRKLKSVFQYFERVLYSLNVELNDLNTALVNDVIRRQVFGLCAEKLKMKADDFKRLKTSTLMNYFMKSGVSLNLDVPEIEI